MNGGRTLFDSAGRSDRRVVRSVQLEHAATRLARGMPDRNGIGCACRSHVRTQNPRDRHCLQRQWWGETDGIHGRSRNPTRSAALPGKARGTHAACNSRAVARDPNICATRCASISASRRSGCCPWTSTRRPRHGSSANTATESVTRSRQTVARCGYVTYVRGTYVQPIRVASSSTKR
jgi:hypothetical protein